MSASELQAYGWAKEPGSLIWRQPHRHLTLVSEPKPLVTPKPMRKGRTCGCGKPMGARSTTCVACYRMSATAPPTTAPVSEQGVDELMEILGRNLRATPVPRLPVHLCDCGCLLRLDEALCPECRDWAERNAAVWSWTA